MRGPCEEADVLEAFKVFDLERSGYLPAQDLVQILSEMGDPLSREDVLNLLRELTIDGDHRVNIAEFVRHMFKTSKPGY